MTFEFEIGDLVTTHAAIEECRMAGGRAPRVGMIVERISQECPGGFQRQYRFRLGSSEMYTFNEIEVVAVSEAAVASDSIKNISSFKLLQAAKESFVSELWFGAAAKIRDLLDELKAEKAAKEVQQKEGTK